MVTALPTNFNTGQITGRFVDLQGRFEQGKITFAARAPRLESDGTDTVVIGVPIVVELINGEINIALPATDDPDITPTGFTYQVTEDFSNGYLRQYDIDVPVGSVTDLSDVVSTDPSTGETVIRTPSDPPQLIDLTGESGAVALDLSTGIHEVEHSVSAVLIQCDDSVTLTVTPPSARQTRLGVVVRVTGGGDVVLKVAGNADELSGSDEVSAYLEPVPSGLETPMVFGPRVNPTSISETMTWSAIDAKGDLLVGTANDTVGRRSGPTTAGEVLVGDPSDPTGLGWASGDPLGAFTCAPTPTLLAALANHMFAARWWGGGTFTKIAVLIGTSSGNICVAAYSSINSSYLAIPNARLGTSGSIPCPAGGWAEISLGGSVSWAAGDWGAVGWDNATATSFGSAASASTLGGHGFARYQASAFPAPTTLSPAGSGDRQYRLWGVA